MTKRITLPVIYFVFRRDTGPKSTRFGGFITRLTKSGLMPEANYKSIALEELVFCIDTEQKAAVYDTSGVQVLHDASFVYFKSWEGMPEQAAMVVSYLQAKGIPFEDQAVRHAGLYKAAQIWKLWAADVPVVPTIVATTKPSLAMVLTTLGKPPYLIKPLHGEKGKGVEKCPTYAAIPDDIHDHVLQPFVENKGDYRVLTYGYEARGTLFRVGQKGSVVNNTSQGADSQFIEVENLPEGISLLAERAARVTEHTVAGVDVMQSATSGKLFVLEVNQGSQIVTGHFTDKKIAAFASYLKERHDNRYTRAKQSSKLQPIGRHVRVNLPELGMKGILARVDTGAYQSVLHASDIREYIDEAGRPTLEYRVLYNHGRVTNVPSDLQRTHDFTKAIVRNSFGNQQTRYAVMVRISINGRMMRTGVTLTDRSDMTMPILLGRRFLRGRYTVNVELGKAE